MTSLANHQSTRTVKMLLIGDSGSGKTGALASLANAGYKLRIQDYDNGLDALVNFIKPEFHANVEFVTLTDKLKSVNGLTVCDGPPNAYVNGVQLLSNWKYKSKSSGEDIDFGPIFEWGEDVVLVIDSLTFQGKACLRYILSIANHFGNPQLQHWGEAMRKQEELLQILYSDAVKCHVIITSHIIMFEREDGIAMGYPSALGSKLPPIVPRYFNSVLQTKTIGQGASARREIRTSSQGMVELKNPAPMRVPPTLPLESGLATFFELILKAKK